MLLKTVSGMNFRNFDFFKIDLSPSINVIYGDNGHGKTNILESIYFLGITKSHRVNKDTLLIQKTKSYTKIKGKFERELITSDIEMELTNLKKTIKVNSEEKKVIDYLTKVNVIIFYPDDLKLIKGAPNERRRFLNVEISQTDKKYLYLLSEYNKLLKIRNELLKSKSFQTNENYYNIINNLYIEKGIAITKMRSDFIGDLNKYCDEVYYHITGLTNFQIKYLPSFNKKEIQEEIDKIKYKEEKYGTTLLGPHRDDFNFELDSNDLKQYGSQGQQRVGVLSLKLAELKFFENKIKKKPILLLDDVFSELDDSKKNNLLKYLDGSIQTIITTTDIDNINHKILKNAKIFNVVDGKINEIGKV